MVYVMHHYLPEAAKVIYAADCYAKQELNKQVRGVRGIARSVISNDHPVFETVQGDCLAVGSALSDHGRPPLEVSGIKLPERLTLIEQSLERVAQSGD